MTKGYKVIVVGKGNDAPRVGSIGYRKQALEYISDASSQVRLKIVANEVGIGFGHGSGTSL
eukprot:scaffold54967_cov45-Attheya_sp.AAC.2